MLITPAPRPLHNRWWTGQRTTRSRLAARCV